MQMDLQPATSYPTTIGNTVYGPHAFRKKPRRTSAQDIAPEKGLCKHGKTQRELVDELGVSRSLISELPHHKKNRFSADKLVSLIHRAGKRVEIQIAH